MREVWGLVRRLRSLHGGGMTWFANAEKRRAVFVVRHIKSRDVYIVRGVCHIEFEVTPAKLEASGYRQVKHRPKYTKE